MELNPQSNNCAETMVRDALVEFLGSPPEDEKEVTDDKSSVLGLRNLLREGKINKSQFVGGLGALVATGLISKAEFTRLKASC